MRTQSDIINENFHKFEDAINLLNDKIRQLEIQNAIKIKAINSSLETLEEMKVEEFIKAVKEVLNND